MDEGQAQSHDERGVGTLFYLRLFVKLFTANLRAQTQYRINFVVSIFHIAVLQLGTLGLLWVVLASFHSLRGWAFGEVAFLVGLRLLSHGLFVLFMPQMLSGVNDFILSGEFDRFLLKPVSPLFLVMNNTVLLNGITDFSSGVAILCIASASIGLRWSFLSFLALLVVIPGAFFIELAVSMAISAASFWVLKLEALSGITFLFHEQYILYPISIYSKPMQVILTFVIPFAFINFYPATYFLDKSSATLFHPAFAYLTPLVGALSFMLARSMWIRGIRQYQSTGS